MVETVRLALRLIVVVVASFGAVRPVAAHVLDEYLQATLVAIEPGDIRLSMNLTPGVEIADKVIKRLDQDRGGVVSSAEADSYIQLLKRDLTVRLDGREVELNVAGSFFPEPEELM